MMYRGTASGDGVLSAFLCVTATTAVVRLSHGSSVRPSSQKKMVKVRITKFSLSAA